MDWLEKLNITIAGISLADLAAAALILIIGLAVIKYVCRLTEKMLSRSGRLDPSVRGFLLKAARVAVTFVLVISCADRLGIPTASLVTVLGTAGLALSLALQDSIKNLAGGVLLLASRPISTGDFVEIGAVSGTVYSIGLIHTALTTADNSRVYIPNGAVTSGTVINRTAEATRRTELLFPIPYGCDVEKAKDVLRSVFAVDSRVRSEADVRVWQLSASSVDVMVRAYIDTPDFLNARCDLLEAGMSALEKEGMSVPFNRLDVNILDGKR